MNETNKFDYLVDNKNYQVTVVFKKRKTYALKFDNSLGLQLLISEENWKKYRPIVDLFIVKNIPKVIIKSRNYLDIDLLNNSFYLFGKKVKFTILDSFIYFTYENEVHYIKIKKSKNLDVGKEIKKYLKELLLKKVTEYSQYYWKLIYGKETTYEIKIMNSKTAWGKHNFFKKILSYDLKLVHFKEEAIKNIVVHEVAHYRHHNHKKPFYDLILKYKPNYKIIKKFINDKDIYLGEKDEEDM